MKMRIVLVGGGGHASDILGAFEARGESRGESGHPIIGIVDDAEVDPHRFRHRGVTQIGRISDLKHIDASHYILALGFSQERRTMGARVAASGLTAATIVHPKADIPKSIPVGEGTVILSGVRMSPMATVGNHVYLSHGCLIGHDCQMHDYTTVLPGAGVSGDTILCAGCQIGTNATVVQGLTIGENAIVGAGAVVLKSVANGLTVVGNPARPLVR
jgi:sugar O-acyltransferase (sialic acid O-acetyltransferase NeuD family)